MTAASSRGGGGIGGGRPAIPSAPPVVALAGKGLCDVRASPCRDLVILGDGFVSHESFQCSFEVYQVGPWCDSKKIQPKSQYILGRRHHPNVPLLLPPFLRCAASPPSSLSSPM